MRREVLQWLKDGQHEILERAKARGLNTGELMELIADRINISNAYLRVRRNHGSHGVDGRDIDETIDDMKRRRGEILESLLQGKYKATPVRGVEIPKPNGGTRQLGIPTVQDRIIQQAVHQILSILFEPLFSDSSYGFRPGRSALDAVEKARKFYEEGYRYVVDIDMSKFFDTLNHDLLLEMLRWYIHDERVILLIKSFLKSGMMKNGVVVETEAGSPQGGNLSPLLSNIYLTPFDRELERRGHRFVRYADDVNIYVKSKHAAIRVMRSCTRFLEQKLKLRVNREKSQIGSPIGMKFLGYTLQENPEEFGAVHLGVHPKPVERLKSKVREITRRGGSIKETIRKLNQATTGWVSYYRKAHMILLLRDLDGWIRRRIRMLQWRYWKEPKTRYQELRKLGIGSKRAYIDAYSSKGPWVLARSWSMHRGFTNAFIGSLGYKSLVSLYEHFNPPAVNLCTLNRRVPNGTHGGVGGRLAN